VQQQPWQGLELTATGADGIRVLRGAASIREHHDHADTGGRDGRPAPVHLRRTGPDSPMNDGLDLGRWLAARPCALCGR
jgi:hypothetical protein